MTNWIAYAPFYLAYDLGYYDESNVEFSFKLDSNLRYKLFRSGDLDCVSTSINTFCREVPPFDTSVVLAIVQVQQPGSERIVAKESFRSLSDLQGATLCLVPFGLEHFYFRYFFDQAGVPFAVNLLEAKNREEMREMFLTGKADATILYEPYIDEFNSKKGFHIIPNDADLSVIIAVLVINRNILASKEEDLRSLIEGYFKALIFFNSSPEDALTRLMRYFRTDVKSPLQNLRDKFTGFQYIEKDKNLEILTESKQVISKAIRESVRVWKEIGLLTSDVDPAIIIESRFVAH